MHILRTPCRLNKDETEAEFAVEYALQHGCQLVIFVAAASGCLDRTSGNVALLASHTDRIALFDETFTLVAVDGSETYVFHGQVGTLVSLIPYGLGRFTVRSKGLKYLLQDESLSSATHGLSNELSQTETYGCVSNGVLVVYIQSENSSFGVSEDPNEVDEGKHP